MSPLLRSVTHAFLAAAFCGATATLTGAQEISTSPAEQKILAARKTIAAQPERPDGYNALAMALARRARETSNVQFYLQADEAVAKSLAISPGNFEARKAGVWVRLGKHEFAAALEEAQALNKLVPDDVLVYGYLVDASIELGQYAQAERAAQWMLDLRPGNVPGLTRAAYLRELFGDVEGAIELMEKAFQRTAPTEVEDRAWILTQLAHLNLARGRLELAAQLLDNALMLFPDYHYAVGLLAKVRVQQKRYDDAVALARKHYALAPHAENLFYLGEALVKAHRMQEARATFANFEQLSLAESVKLDNSNHELVFYYVDYARKPDRALATATLEASRRQDAFTLDALAWALSANGRHADASAAMKNALQAGIRDAAMLYRAGIVERRAGNKAAAADHLRQSLATNAQSEVADAARRALAEASRPMARAQGTGRAAATQ